MVLLIAVWGVGEVDVEKPSFLCVRLAPTYLVLVVHITGPFAESVAKAAVEQMVWHLLG